MPKKKGKKADPEKKAALQAKKEAKADKKATKRLHKDGSLDPATVGSVDDVDSLLEHYQQQDVAGTVESRNSQALAMEGFPAARANASWTLYEDTKKSHAEAYLFGGEYYDGVENIVLDHLYKIDLTRNEWKQIVPAGPAPPPRCAHSAAYANHHIYVFGGELASADQYHHYRDLWKYSIKDSQWAELKPSKAVGSHPTARSGHQAVTWKHFMILFGGFYEALRDTPRWYNDVYVFNLQTESWMDVPHSKLTARPEPRSACNAAVIGDQMIVHGGFSKLSKSILARSNNHNNSQINQNNPEEETSETKTHSDAWVLQLKPLLTGQPPIWERLLSSTQRGLVAAKNPNNRAGTASVAYKSRLLAYGGVVDQESHNHKIQSIFYNDLFALDVARRKWFPVHVKKMPSNGTGSKRRRRKEDSTPEQSELPESKETFGDDIEESENDSDLEEDEHDDDNGETHAWDLDKLRSNMFAFVDGNGNTIYEKIEEESDDEVGYRKQDSEEEKEETKQEELEQPKPVADHSESSSGEEKEQKKEPVSKAKTSPLERKVIASSSVMVVDPETKIPEAVARTEPLPRINASLLVSGHTLFVYGGLLEVGDREVTLDDLWSFDLRKREKWECHWPGTMHKQVWRGAIHDDDDSYYSSTAAALDDDEEERESDLSDDERLEEKGTTRKPKKKSSGLRQEIAELNEKYHLGDGNRTPQPGEALSDFYARTSDYWNQQAADRMPGTTSGVVKNPSERLSNKELKREGFGLANARFVELEPVIERLHELDLEREERKGLKKEKKDKSKKKDRRH
jgi:N-acetylneuraminic acid mutarotase